MILIAPLIQLEANTNASIIAKMIIMHEYPFRMVEDTWFIVLLKALNSLYQCIGRRSIRGECINIYNLEKECLKKSLRSIKKDKLDM